MNNLSYFGATDFVVFAVMLLVSFGIGVFFSYKDKKGNTTDNYYFGKRKLSMTPVAISLSVSLVSAITVISFPVETYKYGTVLGWFSWMSFLSCGIAAIYFIPTLRKLNCKSVYEVLERRYNKKVKLLASSTQLVITLVKMGVIIYLPALALSAVTPLKLSWVIAVTTIVCTAYTTMGGMKAVIWTDVFQAGIMFIGSLAVFIKVSYDIQDQDVIQVLKDAGRWNVFDFTANPTQRLNFWTLGGMSVFMIFTFCCHQAFVQRHLSCRTTREAQIAVMISVIPQSLLLLLSTAVGSVAFVYFKSCDPVQSKMIQTYDQTIPYLALKVFKDYPGMAGLFVSAAYSGSLSSMVWDIILCVLSACCLGLIVMGLAYASAEMGSDVLRFLLTVHGMLSGAVFGAFLLAMFVPWSNWKGAVFGQLLGVGFACFLTIGAIANSKVINTNAMIPLLKQTCAAITNNTISLGQSSGIIQHESSYLVSHWFSLSHYLYGPIVLLITVVMGIFISFITGAESPSEADAMIFVPLFDNKRLPESIRKFFRFGVPEVDQYFAGNEMETVIT